MNYFDLKTKSKFDSSTGIVYTKSTDGVSLLGNGIPMNTKENLLYTKSHEWVEFIGENTAKSEELISDLLDLSESQDDRP